MALLPAAIVKTKTPATITNMDYQLVDILNADQLEVGDLIGVDEYIVEIVNIVSLPNGYILTFKDEYGEKDFIEIDDNQKFNLYIIPEEDE